MSPTSRYEGWMVLLVAATLVLGGCDHLKEAGTRASGCATVTGIEGEYRCTGQCVAKNAAGVPRPGSVFRETDTIQRIPDTSEELYQVTIAVGDTFHEVEIGALAGRILRASTAKVSRGGFPVLEEYVFETDPLCNARGFTKIVRNPSKKHFKTCVVRCERAAPP